MIDTSDLSSQIEIQDSPSSLSTFKSDVGTTSIQLRDQQLVCAAQSGCQSAFNELFSLYSRRIYRSVLAITKNPADAEDAMQDSFLRAFVAINRFEGRASFYSWLTRIAINSALLILRKRRAHPESDMGMAPDPDGEVAHMDFKDSAPDPEEVYCQSQRRTQLVRAIQRLAPNLRQIVQARLAEDCSVKELAAKFNISEAAAKSRLYQARMRLGSFPKTRNGFASNVAFSSMPIPIPERTHLFARTAAR